MRDHETATVVEGCYALALAINRFTTASPKKHRHLVVHRLAQLSLDLLQEVARANAARDPMSRSGRIREALEVLFALTLMQRLARDMKMISIGHGAKLAEQSSVVGAELRAWLKWAEKVVSSEK